MPEYLANLKKALDIANRFTRQNGDTRGVNSDEVYWLESYLLRNSSIILTIVNNAPVMLKIIKELQTSSRPIPFIEALMS